MANVEPQSCSTCSVERAISVIGGKWKLYLLRVLISEGEQRFNALLGYVQGISPKVLTQNLRELEEAGVIERVGRDGARVYAMTPSGIRLQSAMHGLGEWVEQHEVTVPSPPRAATRDTAVQPRP